MEKVILRAVGYAGMVHGVAGFIVSVFILFTPEPASLVGEQNLVMGLQQAARIMDESLLANAAPRNPQELLEVVSMPKFRSYVFWFSAFGAAWNFGLVLGCRALIRTTVAAATFFLSLMVVHAVYLVGLPVFLADRSDSAAAAAAAAAWGVGNLGLSLMILSYYWIWGPLLVLFVAAFGTGEEESPPTPKNRGTTRRERQGHPQAITTRTPTGHEGRTPEGRTPIG